MLRPTLVFCVIISTIGGLQLFTEPVLFSGSLLGGTGRETQTISMYMFESAFSDFNFGYGSAAAWMLFLLIIIIAVANALVLRRIGSTDGQGRRT
jgi:cellobiose transport system permease protein